MDKSLACHAIALEAAKTFVANHMTKYEKLSNSEVLARDMAQQYINDYLAAMSVFGKAENREKIARTIRP